MVNSPVRVTFGKKAAWALRCGYVSGKSRLWVVCLILVAVTAACAGCGGAGLYVSLSPKEKRSVLEELKKNWQDYDIYCDGPAGTPGAIIFDPKNDDRILVGYRYVKLTKEEYVLKAIRWMEFLLNYEAVLYRIFDEEKNFYGYVLVAGDLPVPKRLDPKTLELPSFQCKFYSP